MAKKETKKSDKPKKPKSAQERVIEFVEAYLLNFNASKAYSTVFDRPIDHSVHSLASTYLSDPTVQQYLQKRLKERRDQLHIDQTYVVRKYVDIVETDYTQGVQVMSGAQLKAMPENIRMLVQGVKIKKKTFENEQENGRYNSTTTEEYEVTFMSKDKAIEALGRHTGTFAKDNVKGVADLSKMSYTDFILHMSELPDDDE